jgi:hypothetical protein
VELDTRSIHRRGLTLPPVNKVHHVYTISRVAKMLGEDEDWLWDIATDMDQEDGLIWVHPTSVSRPCRAHPNTSSSHKPVR